MPGLVNACTRYGCLEQAAKMCVHANGRMMPNEHGEYVHGQGHPLDWQHGQRPHPPSYQCMRACKLLLWPTPSTSRTPRQLPSRRSLLSRRIATAACAQPRLWAALRLAHTSSSSSSGPPSSSPSPRSLSMGLPHAASVPGDALPRLCAVRHSPSMPPSHNTPVQLAMVCSLGSACGPTAHGA